MPLLNGLARSLKALKKLFSIWLFEENPRLGPRHTSGALSVRKVSARSGHAFPGQAAGAALEIPPVYSGGDPGHWFRVALRAAGKNQFTSGESSGRRGGHVGGAGLRRAALFYLGEGYGTSTRNLSARLLEKRRHRGLANTRPPKPRRFISAGALIWGTRRGKGRVFSGGGDRDRGIRGLGQDLPARFFDMETPVFLPGGPWPSRSNPRPNTRFRRSGLRLGGGLLGACRRSITKQRPLGRRGQRNWSGPGPLYSRGKKGRSADGFFPCGDGQGGADMGALSHDQGGDSRGARTRWGHLGGYPGAVAGDGARRRGATEEGTGSWLGHHKRTRMGR